MTRADCMEAQDRLEEAKADLAAAETLAEREDARAEINHWSRVLHLGGYEEQEQ